MKKILVAGLLTCLTTIGWAVISQKQFEKNSSKINYEMISDGVPTIMDPADSKHRAQLAVFTQLPSDCWTQTEWKQGEWGRIALLKGKCQVEQNARWYAEDKPTRRFQ
jgi:predicted negative regulator of RcsB-dependent stress response